MIRPALLSLPLLLALTAAASADTIYAYVEGDAVGEIRGDVTQPGREGAIEIRGWTHEVVSPRDAATGLPTGKRQHRPFTVTKPVDKATPLLFQALTTNENLRTVRLEFARRNAAGAEEVYLTITLTNAQVSSWAQRGGVTLPTLKDKPVNKRRPFEEVSFTYQRIEITYEDGGITAVDDWAENR